MTPSTEASVTWAQALAWRMECQFLDPLGAESATGVVRRLGAVLSMDASFADLVVATRCSTTRPGPLAMALADGQIINVFAFRGSMHYVTPEEGGIYLALRAAGQQWELPSWVEHYRLSATDWPQFRHAVREALSGGPLTWQGDLSLGPPRDGQFTVQRLDTNPRWPGIPDLDDAGPRAVLAYLRAYGPATPEHLQYWLGHGLSAGTDDSSTGSGDSSIGWPRSTSKGPRPTSFAKTSTRWSRRVHRRRCASFPGPTSG